ncbi:MAG: hypothetical protein CM1200mP14_22890 [Gammaproteobacteria bacterium]|nr:MAG: hypothetical protein CM1200mP14_22890 [Gammaproteobacteria bacterium]
MFVSLHGKRFHLNLQYFAQEGYASCDQSTWKLRYGRDFRFANVRDWGYGDMDDLMEGVDEVIDMGVHTGLAASHGMEYGGYMTSFAVTRTDRFKAASMGAGPPNLVRW